MTEPFKTVPFWSPKPPSAYTITITVASLNGDARVVSTKVGDLFDKHPRPWNLYWAFCTEPERPPGNLLHTIPGAPFTRQQLDKLLAYPIEPYGCLAEAMETLAPLVFSAMLLSTPVLPHRHLIDRQKVETLLLKGVT